MNAAKPFTVALATPDDVFGMQEVFYHGWLATYPNAEYGITVDDVEDKFRDRYAEEVLARRRGHITNPPVGETAIVAKHGETVVGVCFVLQDADTNRIRAIYVLPEYHGRGIGTAMCEYAQQYFDPEKPTLVDVAVYNTNAIRFYEKLGFQDTGKRMREARFAMKSGAVIPDMEMRRAADLKSIS